MIWGKLRSIQAGHGYTLDFLWSMLALPLHNCQQWIPMFLHATVPPPGHPPAKALCVTNIDKYPRFTNSCYLYRPISITDRREAVMRRTAIFHRWHVPPRGHTVTPCYTMTLCAATAVHDGQRPGSTSTTHKVVCSILAWKHARVKKGGPLLTPLMNGQEDTWGRAKHMRRLIKRRIAYSDGHRIHNALS